MSIIFENIDTKETVAINRELEGKYYRAKLAAVMNSSNLSPNADRGQDYGWRLNPEQQAILEEWEQDSAVIDKVANFTKVPSDALTHSDFLAYMLYLQELGNSPEKKDEASRRGNQKAYDARVEALRNQEKAEPVAPFSMDDLKAEEEAIAVVKVVIPQSAPVQPKPTKK